MPILKTNVKKCVFFIMSFYFYECEEQCLQKGKRLHRKKYQEMYWIDTCVLNHYKGFMLPNCNYQVIQGLRWQRACLALQSSGFDLKRPQKTNPTIHLQLLHFTACKLYLKKTEQILSSLPNDTLKFSEVIFNQQCPKLTLKYKMG